MMLMIMLVPILAISLGFFAVWSHHRHKLAKLQVEAVKASAAGRAAPDPETVRELQERVQVLERIATDNNRAVSLDEEIEKLRDRSHP